MYRLAGLVLALAVLLKTDLLIHVEVVLSRTRLHERPDGKRRIYFRLFQVRNQLDFLIDPHRFPSS